MYSINNSLQDMVFVNDNTKKLVIPKSYVRYASLLERMAYEPELRLPCNGEIYIRTKDGNSYII